VARHRLEDTTFARVHPLYVAKAERKGRTAAEVDAAICWLTGYDAAGLGRVLADGVDLATFFAHAPRITPHAREITGTVCGVRVQDVEDPLLQQIRWMDLLVDELARGKALTTVLRGSSPSS